MTKKIIKLTENELEEIIKESIDKILDESTVGTLNHKRVIPTQDNNSQLITEMARINTQEPNGSLFPYSVFDVHIWSNDHNPPHFHILKDDWDVEFFIETGDLYKIKKQGKDKKIYHYMVNNVKSWLKAKSIILPQITNKENANAIWTQLHS